MSKAPTNERILEETARFPDLVDLVVDGAGNRAFLTKDGRALLQYEQDGGGSTLIPDKGEGVAWALPDFRAIKADYDGLKAGRTHPDSMFMNIREALAARAALPTDDYYDLLTAWIFHTYRQDWLDYSPVLFLFGVSERGKSRIGKTIAFMSYRGIPTGTLNEAALFWWPDRFEPTLFVDVVDVKKKAMARGSLDTLCNRFERGHKELRINPEKAGSQVFRTHAPFGPTILASNEMLDECFTSRGLFLVPPNAPGVYKKPHESDLVRRRAMLTAWRWWTMAEEQAPDPNVRGAGTGRWQDITQPLRQITAMVAPDRLPAVDAALAHLYRERQEQKGRTTDAELLRAVVLVRRVQADLGKDTAVSTEDVRDQFEKLAGWPKPPGARYVGIHLQALGFQAVKLEGGLKRGWACRPERFDDLVRQYGLEDGWTDRGQIEGQIEAVPALSGSDRKTDG